MAHQLKYYKEIESHGHTWDLYIYQDTDETFTAVEIGPVLQGLRLVVQGDQPHIDTPIVKTSLEMVFGDAPDLEEERKCGYWEEFYTSSATEYQIRLDKDGSPEWTGYITPDSFSEDLRYRGSVTIIARDNLGTLQDTTFDMIEEQNTDGKVYLVDLLEKAMTLSTCPLNLNFNYDDMPFAVGIFDVRYEMSGNLLYQMIDLRAMKDKTWWNALEKSLYSVGLVLRYVGANTLKLMTLRDLPKMGGTYWWNVPVKDVQFVSYGHRELMPGIKSIAESVEFDPESESELECIDKYDGRSTRTLHRLKFYDSSGNMVGNGSTSNVPCWGYTNMKSGGTVTAASSALLNVEGYPKVEGEDSEAYGKWDDKTIVYYAVNAFDSSGPSSYPYPLVFSERVWSSNIPITISMVIDKPVTLLSDYSKVLNLPVKDFISAGESPQLIYRIRHQSMTGETTYYNASSKSWGTSSNTNVFSPIGKVSFRSLFDTDNPQPVEFKVEDIAVPSAGTLIFEVLMIFISGLELQLRQPCTGLFMRLRDIRLDAKIPEDLRLLDKVSLTTNYSDKYSVRITRSPELGICPSVLPEVAYIANSVLTEGAYQYTGAEQWVWQYGKSFQEMPEVGISLSRLIHQQLLAYHAKPNNLLTGELVTEEPTFNALYRWNGKNHMLMSGSLNILTGRMENVVLREFTRYDHMWETHIIEGEDQTISGSGGSVYINVVGAKELAKADVKNLPSWLSLNAVKQMPDGAYRVWLTATAGSGRSAIIKIDTAYARITQ